MKKSRTFFISLLFWMVTVNVTAQRVQSKNLVYVDMKGVLRYTKDNKEAAFFGVNYTVPFAYGYRSHKALSVDLEKAIDADVHHIARLGLDAFRVHVWDVDITDSLGNLLENEHLRLFDYLLKKLKERNIKILITPIAFWGNGYPEKDVKTNGFSYVYGKGPSVVKEEAFKAQENYLKQFFTHVNPYTKLTYKDDVDVIAMEINNEPHHSGPKERTTEYVNRMTAAVKNTGWSKPIFYNISESPRYADAVVKANVVGHSFQWYPTGLVAGHEQRGNFLPHVGHYFIPFSDTIAEFKNRAKMVYEFDAADIMQPIMYPAMARSYRTAGFQWATQFAYDPMATAYANTEYQTHYLNLAYTPAKAISLLIASKAFHQLPRNKSYGTYPADTLFDAFRVSYKQGLSEMNSEEEFYYSNSTNTKPKNVSKLKHIAGVGSSSIVKYDGTGAYFLDKIEEGVWRLEVMPDAISIRDPFEKASLKKEVTRIQWQANKMQLNLPIPKTKLIVKGINQGNDYKTIATVGEDFFIQPGVYFISSETAASGDRLVSLPDFYAPVATSKEPFVIHKAFNEISSGKPFFISAKITGIDSTDKVTVELRNSSNKWKTLTMQRTNAYNYSAEIPADMVSSGVINYRIMIQKGKGDTYTFPGAIKGDPYAWDEYRNESWQTYVATPGTPLELFNATANRSKIMLYNPDWRNNTIEYISSDKSGQLALKTTMNKPLEGEVMGWQYFFGDGIAGRTNELSSFTKLVVKARLFGETKTKISLITANAEAYSAPISLLKDWTEIEIPLSSLHKDAFLLLPRPYPGFLPLRFETASKNPLSILDAEKIEISFGEGIVSQSPISVEVEWVYLKKQR